MIIQSFKCGKLCYLWRMIPLRIRNINYRYFDGTKYHRTWVLDSFDFQTLSHLISQMTVLISKIYRVWFLKWHFWFPKFDAFNFSDDTFDFQNLTRFDFSNGTFDFQIKLDAFWFLKWHFWFPKLVAFDFSNGTFNFQNFVSLPAGGSQEPIKWSLHLPYKPLESTLSRVDL